MAVYELYSAWFCPYAQRAWIAAEELGVPYELKEVDPYDKSESNPLRKVNLRVLVPALRHGERNIYESLVCVEYLDEEFGGGKMTQKKLMPADAYERAMTRIALDTLGKTIVPAFYKTLQTKPDNPDSEAQKGRFLASVREVDSLMGEFQDRKARKGQETSSFFAGGDFDVLDIALAPWGLRLFVLEHYRGLQVPTTPEYSRFNAWCRAINARDSVKKTIADDKKLIENYTRYA